MIDAPSAVTVAAPRSGWATMRSSVTTSPSGSMPKPSNSMSADCPLRTRPSSVSAVGARLASASITCTRTSAVSASAGAPVVKTEYSMP